MGASSGSGSCPSGIISLRYFTGAIVCHELASTPRAWGMDSPVTHTLTPWKIAIGFPGTSCEPIYHASSHKYHTTLCFPFLWSQGNLWVWNFLWVLTASITQQEQRHVATWARSSQKQRPSHQRNPSYQAIFSLEKKEKDRKEKAIKPSQPHTLQPTPTP